MQRKKSKNNNEFTDLCQMPIVIMFCLYNSVLKPKRKSVRNEIVHTVCTLICQKMPNKDWF